MNRYFLHQGRCKNMEKNEKNPVFLQYSSNNSHSKSIEPRSRLSFEDQAIIASWVLQKGKKTQIYYKRIVKNFFMFFPQLNLKTTQITHLVLFLKTYKDFSDSTRNTYKNALSSLFGFAFKTGYIDKNPAANLENLKVPDRLYTKVLSHEQIQQMLLKEKNPRNSLIIKMFYYTGIRVDELTKLRRKSFQQSSESLVMMVEGKGRKVRTIHIPSYFKDEILEFIKKLQPEDYLFKNERRLDFELGRFGIINDLNKSLDPSQVFRIIKNAAKNADLSVSPSPHWLRHTSATHAIEGGAPIHVVQKSLGHESISTTGKYLDIRPKESVGNYLKKI